MDNNQNTYICNNNSFDNPRDYVCSTYEYTPPSAVRIKSTRFPLPAKGTGGAAAYDLQADLSHVRHCELLPGSVRYIPTGLTLELPSHLMALILPRSGLATNHGITLANSVGLIDPDYRGEIKIAVKNTGTVPFTISDGDRVAQMLIMGFVSPAFVQVKEIFPTTRGTGGFGSTGV